MKKAVAIFFFSFITTIVFAQKTITLRLKLPSENPYSEYYFASNLNGWNPKDKTFKFVKNDRKEWLLKLPSTNTDLIQFKITRGAWDSVETSITGDDIGNRVIKVSEIISDTTIDIAIKNWKDNFSKPRVSSASKNVKIISENFPLTSLGKTRRVWIYLPESYATTKRKYPVIYMHDGQNLFDVLTGPFGEWGVDECLDTLSKKINFEVIVVGIDNGGEDRLSEYSPYNFKVNADEVNVWDVKGTGSLYLESLVKDVKPFIDKNYRTKSNVKHTSICGSSMGGLISLYALIRYPETFGSAGVFSPAFWTNENELPSEITKNKLSWKGNIYMISGELEGKRYTKNMFDISTILLKKNKKNIVAKSIPQGQHNEAFWRQEFPLFYTWLSKVMM